MSKLRRFFRLPPARRGLLLRAALLLTLVRVSLRIGGFRRTRAWLEALPGARRAPASSVQVQDVAAGVESAAHHHPLAPTCLERSLVLWALLRARGVVSQLCVGARCEGGVFSAHAWVEYEGVVLNDRPDVAHAHVVLADVAQGAP